MQKHARQYKGVTQPAMIVAIQLRLKKILIVIAVQSDARWWNTHIQK